MIAAVQGKTHSTGRVGQFFWQNIELMIEKVLLKLRELEVTNDSFDVASEKEDQSLNRETLL